MKLGITYNVFDSEELLEYSILQVRDFAHIISVVYQEVSNFGNKNEKLKPLLEKLQQKGLIDLLIPYTPTFDHNENNTIKIVSGSKNEQNKRNIGIDICRANGCDIFMNMDCDELYDKKEFEWALNDFKMGGYDTSFTQMLTYYKLPTMQLSPPETYYCPLFYKLKSKTRFEYIQEYPVLTDPTRRIKVGHPRIYKRDEIQMHHFSHIRNDIRIKIYNSSSQFDKKSQEAYIYHWEKWEKKEDGVFLLSETPVELIEVENKFNIKL
jgi:hypothetical protein